jgi:predicted metal-dependent HD superfamily phosphohydrolase
MRTERWRFYKATEGLPTRIRNDDFADLVDAYFQPWRVYHTVQHIEELCRHYEAVKEEVGWEKPDAVACALVYHDFVYVPGHPRNEEWSAAEAKRALSDSMVASIPKPDIDAVCAIILATQDHLAEQADRDTRYFVDMDLATLGAEPKRYAEAQKQIRQEYAHVQGFDVGRPRFLTKLLAAGRIFKTDMFHDRYERQAEENIKAELRRYAK